MSDDTLKLRLPFEDGEEIEFRPPTLREFDLYLYQALKAGQLMALRGIATAKSPESAEEHAAGFQASGLAIARVARRVLKATVQGGPVDLDRLLGSAGRQETQVLVGVADAFARFVCPELTAKNSSAGSSGNGPDEPERAAPAS